ncbi:MAG: hypothetical protein J5640_05105 [Bacteroidales bacterium]|nr:hypothetical protein [Bacteroidales bacterium]
MVLHSKFIIDGIPQEFTPAEILASVAEKTPDERQDGGTVLDESLDPPPGAISLDPSGIDGYLKSVLAMRPQAPVPFAESWTRSRIACALIDTMWRNGNFKLDDLPLTAKWRCNPGRVGDMAAFYRSVEAAADYIDNLRLSLRRYSCEEGDFDVQFATPFSGAPLLVDDQLHPDKKSWVVYLPFDTSDYRLGGSMLAGSLGLQGGTAPQVSDGDYLMDCFEVVRELAEDGVLLSAATVGEGGLYTALYRMTRGGTGSMVDISGIMQACGESDPVRILFSEVPGAVVQIRDMDFDYIDAELLLQDVAFFPLGHPSADGRLHLEASAKSGIQTILESLMQNAEGED